MLSVGSTQIAALSPTSQPIRGSDDLSRKKGLDLNPRVLIVEDNEDLCEILSRQLQFFSFQVTVAKHGMDGVAMAQSQQPDVILMDIVMPKMDGLEAVRQIRADPKTRDIPVLAVTAWLSPSSRQHYIARGFNECISKPFTRKDLVHAIGQLLREPDQRLEPSDLIAPVPDRPNQMALRVPASSN